jgi:hypothetical protein
MFMVTLFTELKGRSKAGGVAQIIKLLPNKFQYLKKKKKRNLG